MQKHIPKIVFVLVATSALLAWFWFESASNEVFAGALDNVSGWAWSSNIGWISFNCTDPVTCPPTGADYGVHVDPVTGKFSGHAWSSNIGWISFNRTETGTPPRPPYDGAEDFIACLDFSAAGQPCRSPEGNNNRVHGWGRALSHGGGWDGWIRLRAASWSPGVSWNPVTQELRGWAWGSDVVGWISFNCENDHDETTPGVQPCTGGDYFVKVDFVNDPPTAINLAVDPPTALVYCGRGSPSVRFSWTFQDLNPSDTQSRSQIQVDDDSSPPLAPPFTSPLVYDTEKSGGASNSRVIQGPLAWNTTYFWRLKVWDSRDLESVGWVYPPSPPGFPSALPGTLFQTPSYAYPDPIRFSYAPVAPKIGDSIQFFDDDEGVLGNSFDGDPFEPDVVPSERVSTTWVWDYGDASPTFTTSDQALADPTHIYASPGTYIVTLTVTDEMRNPTVTATCSATKGVTVAAPQGPKWQETSPF